MLRLRFPSQAVSKQAIATTAFAISASALLPTSSVRRYEYPAFGTHKSPEHATELIDKTYNRDIIRNSDGAKAQSLTGSIDNQAYDETNMYDPYKQVEQNAAKYSLFKGNRLYAIDPVTNKQIRETCSLFEKMDQEAMWKSLFRDYPSLKEPLDENTQSAILSMFQQGLENLSNEEEVAALVKPVVLELLETKYIHQPLWWRISEKIALAMAAKADGTFSVRASNVCVERFTKLLYNHSFEKMPWASEDYVCPNSIDICGTRQCTEAGMW